MSVRLDWLLAQPELGLRLVAGRVDRVDVTWAHAIEVLDPSPWLHGGELVLTTGLRMPRARAEQAAYVDRLKATGAAGLGFGVGIRFTEVPRGLVERSEETGLPLLEVPLATPFIAVAQAVARRLAEERERALARTIRLQQELTRTTLRDGLAGLTRRLARELRAEVVVLDEHGTVVAGSAGSAQLAADVAGAIRGTGDGASTAASVLRALSKAAGIEVQTLAGRTARRGWLALEHHDATDPDVRVLVNHAVSVATLHLDRPREVEDARIRVGSSVLSLLLDRAPAAPGVTAHLRHFGFEKGDRVRVISVATPAAPALETAVQAHLVSTGLAHVLTRGRDTGLAGAAAHPDGGELVVLVRSDDAERAAERIEAALATVSATTRVMGVSGPLVQAQVASGLVPARRAARAARLEGRSVGWFDTLTLELLLADDAVRSHIAAMSHSTLDALFDDPAAVEQDLLATLRAYLEHNGSWEAASRALGVHRHTLRNRVARIERLTGLSLEVADNRVVLRLAVTALEK